MMPAGPTDKMSVLRLRELLKDGFVQANSAFEIFEREIFVRRMCAAIGQCESHEQCFDAENFPEFGDNWDAASFTDERGVAVEGFAQCALCRFAHRGVRISEIPRAAVAHGNFHR